MNSLSNIWTIRIWNMRLDGRKKLISFYFLCLPIPFSLIHYCLYFMISPSCLYGTLLKVHLEIIIRSTIFFTTWVHKTLGQKILPFAETGPVRPHHYLSRIFRFMVELSFQPTSQLVIHTYPCTLLHMISNG